MLSDLRKLGLGCHIGNTFVGAFGYADDVILISPTRHSLQLILKTCEEFSHEHSMLFSTHNDPSKSKTKCQYFSLTNKNGVPLKVLLNNDPLPWVDKAKHLGNDLTTKLNLGFKCLSTEQDLHVKRAIFFDRVHSIKQEFGYATPRIVCEIMRIYATSFYGSVLWELNSLDHQKLVRSWNSAVKMIWDLPYQTHTDFIEPLTNCPHLQQMLHSRYIGFAKSLSMSEKQHTKLIYSLIKNDLTSLTGNNLKFLMNKYNNNTIEELFENRHVIAKEKFKKMSSDDEWKIQVLEDLISFRDGRDETELGKEEIEESIFYVTTS